MTKEPGNSDEQKKKKKKIIEKKKKKKKHAPVTVELGNRILLTVDEDLPESLVNWNGTIQLLEH